LTFFILNLLSSNRRLMDAIDTEKSEWPLALEVAPVNILVPSLVPRLRGNPIVAVADVGVGWQ
jgi:hypothetical protein